MAHDITQWLTEIRRLKQQLARTQQEREDAYQSAASWRSRYDAEAKQRRTDIEHLQLTIQTLRTELSTLQGRSKLGVSVSVPDPLSKSEAGVDADLNTVDGLRAELVKALQQCERLQQDLNAERMAHGETRKTLTTALGEAIETFAPRHKVQSPLPTPLPASTDAVSGKASSSPDSAGDDKP